MFRGTGIDHKPVVDVAIERLRTGAWVRVLFSQSEWSKAKSARGTKQQQVVLRRWRGVRRSAVLPGQARMAT